MEKIRKWNKKEIKIVEEIQKINSGRGE